LSLISRLSLSANPFEHYAAETEPKISEYAVRPPYLQAISDRVQRLSSFVLFGDRGAGKSATRITVYSEVWGDVAKNEGKRSPFIVNITDFSSVIQDFQKSTLTDVKLTKLVGFFVLEQLLGWLASLEDAERQVYIEGLDKDERSLVFALLQGLYLPVNEIDREHSTAETLKLLNSAWHTKSIIWMNRRWDSISKIVATVLAGLSKKHVSEDFDIEDSAQKLLLSMKSDSPGAARAILAKLVELVAAFGFSGVSVLIDKVDETTATSNSAEATARLIYPILDHIQLMEVEGFSWVFFLWSNVQGHFNGKFKVRLDKISHANITWTREGLREMIDARVSFFSNKEREFSGLFAAKAEVEKIFENSVMLSMKSPRELIRLFDIIVREHDARDAPGLLDQQSVDIGSDKYVTETIGNWYPDKLLQQVLRLGAVSFVNKDVQSKFKISDQGARKKIQTWEDVGLVKQEGTLPSDAGGKPVYRSVVSDPRVSRMIERRLNDMVGAELDPADMEE
jgi:hypothetical protein